MVSSYAWSANDFPHQSGSISIRFETSVDTPLMVIRSDDAVLMSVAVRHAALWVESPSNEPPIELDIEDTFGVGLGGRHDLTLTFGEFGTRVYLDGASLMPLTWCRPVMPNKASSRRRRASSPI